MEKKYNIVFKGKLVIGYHIQDVRNELVAKFKLDGTALGKLFSGNPQIIKKAVDFDTAQKFLQMMEKIGARCEMEVFDPALTGVPRLAEIVKQATETQFACPNCGFKQKKLDVCSKCGLLIGKYKTSLPESEPQEESPPAEEAKKPEPTKPPFLSEKELEGYKSCVFAYKKHSDDISVLEKLKQKEPDLSWFWVLLSLLIWIILFYTGFTLLKNILHNGFYDLIFSLLLVYGLPVFIVLIGETATKYGIINFFENFLTFGKLKKVRQNNNDINEWINQIEKEKENIEKQIIIFEKPITDYYENYLKDFHLENLYKRRSNKDSYKESLEKFALLVSEADEINKMLVVEKCDLVGYKDYLIEKQIKIAIEGPVDEVYKNKQRDYVTPLGQIINKVIKNSNEPKKIIPPEISYRTARQIDWDAANKQRRFTGSQGEEIAMTLERDYLIQIGSPDLAEKIRHVSKEMGDGLGYDILSYFPNGQEKYIEVKSSTKATSRSLSANLTSSRLTSNIRIALPR